VDASAVLADAEDQVIDETIAVLAQRDQARQSPRPDGRRRDVRQLFHLVLRCMRAGRAEPIIRPSERIATHYYAAGIDLAEDSSATGAGCESRAGDVVLTSVVGQVGIITLDDRSRRNAIGAQMATAVIAALESLRARQVRAIVLRAAAGVHVWSAGHDIDELLPGGRDPLSYNDPLEGLIRAVRTFPAPVIAMVHGTVWGGAVDLVLSCDLAVADETASFAITVHLGTGRDDGDEVAAGHCGHQGTRSRRTSSRPT
jgi:hypothetical protein